MRSLLIRYTDSKYAKSYMTGDLYLSSLSRFWELRNADNSVSLQQDFSEGVATQVPRDALDSIAPDTLSNHVIHDVRCRIEAYGYCNLLCFYRIDAIDTMDAVAIDARYNNLVRFNPVLNNKMNHVVQVPDSGMKKFGDIVVVIRDEEKFIERVLAAVKNIGGECVVGDVRYHPLKINQHHITLISGKGDSHDGLFDMGTLCNGRDDVVFYGSLDKYDVYASQKEWRICWLPDVHNYEAKLLRVGDMSDIVEIISVSEFESKLQKYFPGYSYGHVNETRKQSSGTKSYKEFRNKIESIDGKARIIFDIG